jgi:glycosyltransferase involved in cell wall biosynthesis
MATPPESPVTEAPRAAIYYGGFAFRGGGAFMHAKILSKELERSGWQVDLITLERLPLLVRYVPHVVGKILNYVVAPMGFYYKGRLTRFLYKLLFRSPVQVRIFEDIYLSWNSGIPSVTLLHAVWSDNLQALSLSEAAAGRLVKAEERRIDAIWHPMVTVSEAYKAFLSQTHSGAARFSYVKVVPLGLDLTDFVRRDTASAVRKSMVFCGSLESRKNLRFLLSVFRMLQEKDPEYRLTIIGDGPDRESLEKFCVQHELAVAFLGRLERTAVLAELCRHDVYIHTSVKESFSFSLLEAKLSGLTTIAYRGLEIPAEFIDVPVASFDEHEWLDAIARSGAAQPVEVDAACYSSHRMMIRTLELAHEPAEVGL